MISIEHLRIKKDIPEIPLITRKFDQIKIANEKIVLDLLFKVKPTYFNLNIGTGLGTSVIELVKKFEEVNDVKVPILFDKRRLGDAPYVVADNTLSTSKFNISTKRSIEDMCRDGWKWKKLNPNGF